MAVKKGGLGPKGKGLDALFDSDIKKSSKKTTTSSDGIEMIDINKIEPNRLQPRKQFEEGALEELAASIKEFGVIQPIIVKEKGDYYELIAGERRWRASKIAGIKKIPAVVKKYDEKDIFAIALIENLQREDLNPMEEAAGYKKLADDLSISQEEIAKKVGKSRSAVANSMRLLNLDERVQNFVKEGKLSSGHARTLLAVEDKDAQFEMAERILEDDLSVRNTENMVKMYAVRNAEKGEKEEKPSKFNTEYFGDIEDKLKNILGTKVKLKNKANKGKIEIEFYSDDDLDRLMGLINKIGG
ncbi:MAG: ParB/RepB/Spo0J family partition protein [Firmicutes bacterium]|nr:ParB/RepB/Spo0J family partition protein [Bacillota bacterium]